MSYLDLVLTFMKIGAFSFGGGYAMIPFFEKELVSHNWASVGDFLKLTALSQVLPGPIAIDFSGYLGWKAAGFAGAVIASAALSLPSFLMSVAVTKFYVQFKANTYIQLVFKGIRPAVIGLLTSAAYILGLQPFITGWGDILSVAVLKASLLIISGFLLLKYLKLNPIILIAVCGAAGILLF